MRRILYTFYCYLASYPAIALFCLGSLFLLYLGSGYRPIENSYNAMLQKYIAVKQERERLVQELESIRQGDLKMRLEIFSEDYLTEDAIDPSQLLEILEPSLNASGWDLETVDIINKEFESSPMNFGIVETLYELRSKGVELADGTPFLPLHSLQKVGSFLWQMPPTKDFYKISIERKETGYFAKLGVIYPYVQKPEPNEAEQ